MIKGLCFLCLVVFASCNQGANKADDQVYTLDSKPSVNNSKEDQMSISNEQGFKLDSVKIHVVFYTRPVLEATYTLQGRCANITSISVDGEFSKEVCERKAVRQLESFISRFYINEEDQIILNRVKRDYLESTDYPEIRVIGYRNRKEIFDTRTQIGEEKYYVEYHPKFLEFYELLEGLAKK